MKKQNKRARRKEKTKTIFQILNLVISIFAISFIIASVTEDIKLAEAQGQKLISCCPETKQGAICQEILTDTCSKECKSSCIPSLCEKTGDCKLGCCIDDEGVCAANSPKKACEQGGSWQSDAACNIAECQLGCCVLGSQTVFATEKRCGKLSELYGLETDYRPGIGTEIECLGIAHVEERGACVLETAAEQSCKITTKQECMALTNIADNFYAGYSCSHPDIALCESQAKKGCVEGKDEVYWFDSCGNAENIYSSDKNASWNNGFLLTKAESCNPEQGNANSKDCGNCNYLLGSKCALENNDYICKDSSCKYKGKTWQNGESWCEFDGKIGDGDDTAGSRHWRYVCLNGEVRVEPCADFRNELCVQGEIEEAGKKFSAATCRINNWQQCVFGDGCGETETPDCFKTNLTLGDAEPASVCLPNYPPGFDLTTEAGGLAASSICSLGGINCTVTYVRELEWFDTVWNCKVNCKCLEQEFTEKVNELCRRLGDCGAYTNYLGVVTDKGYSIENAPKLLDSYLKKYSENAEPVEGQKVEPDTSANQLFLGEGSSGNVQAASNIQDNIAKLLKEAYNLKGDYAEFMSSYGGLVAFLTVLGFAPFSIFGVALFPVVGWAFQELLGLGEKKNVVVEFKCKPWHPPTGSTDCEKCNDPMKPCSKYRCISSGQACKFINEGSSNELCVSGTNDGIPPVIMPLGSVFTSGFGYEEIESGMRVRYNGKCIPAFTLVNIGIKTDRPSQCKIDTEHKRYDEMRFYFGESNLFMYNHVMSWLMPSMDALEASGADPNRLADFNLFVKCQDINGNTNEKEYIINFCVSPEKDKTAPLILSTIPKNNGFLKFGTTEQGIQIYLNEPAECRYSSADKGYKGMENNFDCDTSLESMRSNGWLCNTNLKNLTQGENKFYIRCLDQPWLNGTAEENDRNPNQESFVYVLKTSESELHIDSVLPNGTIVEGREPITVVLEAQTSGGVDGSASCQFSFDNISFATFMITLSSSHSQTFNQMTKGSYNIYVKCEDITGNKAEASTSFTLNLDTTPPKVVRVYQEGGLKLITDEKAECAYSNNCNFKFENGTEMTTAYSTEHSTEWQIGKYYIKCRDIWKNEPAGCSIVVQTY